MMLRFPCVSALLLLSSICCSAQRTYSQESQQSEGFAVVELFTSQGCSSCPPADKVLAYLTEFAEEKKLPIYTLSFHVDYWNSLGWKDPYGQAAFSERQRRYAAAFESDRVYTPQSIVNGKSEFVGSRGREIVTAVEANLKKPSRGELTLVARGLKDARSVNVSYRTENFGPNQIVNFALVKAATQNEVPRGENRGRDLVHRNVVQAFSIKPFTRSGEVVLKTPEPMKHEQLAVVSYVQDRETMEIVGAVKTAIRLEAE